MAGPPHGARALGLAHVPEDRHARAMVMDFVAWESAVLGYDGLPEYASHGWMAWPHAPGHSPDDGAF